MTKGLSGNQKGLMKWCWNRGAAGEPFEAVVPARIGTTTHGVIHECLAETPWPGEVHPDDQVVLGRLMDLWAEWRDEYRDWECLLSEHQMCHDAMRYGGTVDAVFADHARRVLWVTDWKTGKRIYPEHLVQLAGYATLLTEGRPNNKNEPPHRLPTGYAVRTCVVRLGKGKRGTQAGASEHYEVPYELQQHASNYFRCVRAAYDQFRPIKVALTPPWFMDDE